MDEIKDTEAANAVANADLEPAPEANAKPAQETSPAPGANPAPTANAEADADANANPDDGTVRKYAPGQVVCVECEHIREMRGETDEVVRRTRSEAAENAVLNAVRNVGVEPDWFVERWVEREKVLVACAVFEDAGKCAPFRKAVNDWANKVRERGEESPVRLRSDAALEREVAEFFTEEWARRRKEQMGRYRIVMEDARKSGKWNGRVAVGEYAAEGEDAKKAFAEVCEALKESCPNDANGEGGIAYSGYWDVGNVARFAFGFPSAEAAEAGRKALEGIGARICDPITGKCEGVELEMTALVIAKMQGEENARKAREEIGKGVEKAVKEGVSEGIAEAAERAMA